MNYSETVPEASFTSSFEQEATLDDHGGTEGHETHDVEMEIDSTIPDVHDEGPIFNEATPFTIFKDPDEDEEIENDDGNASSSDEEEGPEEPPRALTAFMSPPSLANMTDNHDERNDSILNENNDGENLTPTRMRPSSKTSTPHKSSCNTTPSSQKRSFSMTNMAPIPPLQILTNNNNRQYTSPYSGPVAWTVPKRGSSTPFTIYQDPPWYEPESPGYDEEGDYNASDDKENAYPEQQTDGQDEDTNDSNSSGTTTPTSNTPIDNAVFEAENIVELASRNARSRATPDPFGSYAPRRPLAPLSIPRPEGPHRLASEMEMNAEVDAVQVPRARSLRRLRGHSNLRAWARAAGGEEGDGEEPARPHPPDN